MLHGRLGDGLVSYHLAVLDGAGQNRQDNNSAEDLAVRCILAPFIQHKDTLFEGFNVGEAVTYGKEPKRQSITGLTPIGFRFFRPVDVRGERLRIGSHLAWFYGPYSIAREYIYTSEERRKRSQSGEDLADLETFRVQTKGVSTRRGDPKKKRHLLGGENHEVFIACKATEEPVQRTK